MSAKTIIILLFCITACKMHKKTASANTINDNQNWPALKYKAGTVIKNDGIAGCDYVVKLEEERVLEPLNLADSLKKNNLKLWLRFHGEKDKVGICMMGEIVTINDVQYRK